MKITLICNGNVLNSDKSSIGFCNDRLSETGVFQSLKLAKLLKSENIDFIFCSDIGYRRTTTDYITRELENQNFQIYVDPRVREKNAEICSHLLKEYLMQKTDHPDPGERVILNRLFIKSEERMMTSDGNAETEEQVAERAANFIFYLQKTYPSQSHILIVGNKIINAYLTKSLLQNNQSIEELIMNE